MTVISTVFRWMIAVPMAALAFVAGFLLMVTTWKHLGGSAANAYTWAVAVATVSGAMAGTLIAPSRNRKTASHVFAILPAGLSAILALASLAHHTFKITNLFDVLGSSLGGLLVLRAFGRQRLTK